MAAEWLQDGGDDDDEAIVIRRDVGESEGREEGTGGDGGEGDSSLAEKEGMLESSTENSDGSGGVRTKSNRMYSESEGSGGGEGGGVDGESAQDAQGLEEAISMSRQGTPLLARGKRWDSQHG